MATTADKAGAAIAGQPVGNGFAQGFKNFVTHGNTPKEKLEEWSGRGLNMYRTISSGGEMGGWNKQHLEQAQAVGFFSSLKLAAVIKWEHTKGFIIARTGNGWSAPCFYNMNFGGVGVAVGVDDIDSLMLMPSTQCLEAFMHPDPARKMEFFVGARPETGVGTTTEKHMDEWMKSAHPIVYSSNSGFMVDVSAQGGRVKIDEKANALFYGREVTPEMILQGQVEPPAEFSGLYAALNRGSR